MSSSSVAASAAPSTGASDPGAPDALAAPHPSGAGDAGNAAAEQKRAHSVDVPPECRKDIKAMKVRLL